MNKPVMSKKVAKKAAVPAVETTVAKVKESEKSPACVKPELFLQYQGDEFNVCELLERAASACGADKAANVQELKVYLKPEDRAAYFVVNGEPAGKLDF